MVASQKDPRSGGQRYTVAVVPRLLTATALACCFGCEPPPETLGPEVRGGDRPRLPPWGELEPAWPELEPLPAELDMPPWLSMPEPGRVVVSWRTVEPTTGRVRFGASPDYDRVLVSYDLDHLHHLDLGALDPATTYHYELSIDGTDARRRGVFVTPGGNRVRFVHFAEMHAPSSSGHAAAFSDAIRAFRPHVVVESGDMLDDGDNLDHWRAYMRDSAAWISNVILLPAQSNHVTGTDGNVNLRDLFVLPGNERWYPTRFGPVEILTVDSTYGGHPELETEETVWLRDRVAAAHDGVDDPSFVIAAWHYPACSSSYSSRAASREWVMDHLIDALFEGGGADLVLTGHDKYYERSLIDGTLPHITSTIALISPSTTGNNHTRCTPLVTDTTSRAVPFFVATPWRLEATVLSDDHAVIDELAIQRR